MFKGVDTQGRRAVASDRVMTPPSGVDGCTMLAALSACSGMGTHIQDAIAPLGNTSSSTLTAQMRTVGLDFAEVEEVHEKLLAISENY